MSLLFSSLLYMLSFSSVANFSNAPDSSRNADYEHYMQKSKNQKTAATIFLATGIAGGFLILLSALLKTVGDGFVSIISLGTYEPKRRSYTIPLLLIGAAIGGGIVLYSAASRNKKIAENISLDARIGSSPVLQQLSVKNYTYPSLSLKIKL